MKQYIVDAFTDKIFSGNPAAVFVLFNKWYCCFIIICAPPEGGAGIFE